MKRSYLLTLRRLSTRVPADIKEILEQEVIRQSQVLGQAVTLGYVIAIAVRETYALPLTDNAAANGVRLERIRS
jgi:hypothetical protein